ncbi:hypothetical protein PMES_00557 [Profundibacterium mesophilum KAUST100406-0324]|uniref:Uncharacterized protein n=1 Tax=Profundibacterium mesophilum KAUST100406-0324 TaxID=1037889 RepID=A0A921NSD6_9RHOB|nr:hypothetical protein PMES_00557 [Profundibacterium mesophilum KAUST100406-0324]
MDHDDITLAVKQRKSGATLDMSKKLCNLCFYIKALEPWSFSQSRHHVPTLALSIIYYRISYSADRKRVASFTPTDMEKGEPWSHGSPFGSYRFISRAD